MHKVSGLFDAATTDRGDTKVIDNQITVSTHLRNMLP